MKWSRSGWWLTTINNVTTTITITTIPLSPSPSPSPPQQKRPYASITTNQSKFDNNHPSHQPTTHLTNQPYKQPFYNRRSSAHPPTVSPSHICMQQQHCKCMVWCVVFWCVVLYIDYDINSRLQTISKWSNKLFLLVDVWNEWEEEYNGGVEFDWERFDWGRFDWTSE